MMTVCGKMSFVKQQGYYMSVETDLPQKEELVAALAEQPLGNGTEARVYKIHTRPQFTLRVSQALSKKDLPQKHLKLLL